MHPQPTKDFFRAKIYPFQIQTGSGFQIFQAFPGPSIFELIPANIVN